MKKKKFLFMGSHKKNMTARCCPLATLSARLRYPLYERPCAICEPPGFTRTNGIRQVIHRRSSPVANDESNPSHVVMVSVTWWSFNSIVIFFLPCARSKHPPLSPPPCSTFQITPPLKHTKHTLHLLRQKSTYKKGQTETDGCSDRGCTYPCS